MMSGTELHAHHQNKIHKGLRMSRAEPHSTLQTLLLHVTALLPDACGEHDDELKQHHMAGCSWPLCIMTGK